MGSQITCHFTNIGKEVLLFDLISKELNEKEFAKELLLDNTYIYEIAL